MNKALETVEGVLLGDGTMSRRANSEFLLWQKDLAHMDWLLVVARAFHDLGIWAKCSHGGKARGGVILWTDHSSDLSALRDSWYPDGKKEIPRLFELTPISLAHWFMGDGSTSWMRRNYVIARLCTEGFSQESNERLVAGLARLGMNMNIGHRKESLGSYPYLFTGDSIEVTKLMDIIEPYIVPSFKYKIKRPENDKVERAYRRAYTEWELRI